MTPTHDTLRVLIVDDEPVARRRLRRFLLEAGGVTVAGEADSAEGAVELLRSRRADVVFLDVQMPGRDGFSVVDALPEPRPAVVFVTAFEEHAVRAFSVEALDYLLKPFDRTRVVEALARVRRRLAEGVISTLDPRSLRALVERATAGSSYRSRILVRTAGKVQFVPVDEVRWFEADGNYVRLHARSGRTLVRETMSRLERELDPARFVRIHRSTMVNLAAVRELERQATGDHTLALDSGERLVLSRTYREAFERAVEGRRDLRAG